MKCEITGICVKESPQFFRFQPGSKKATVIVDDISSALKEICCTVSRMCPIEAISIEE